MASGSDQRPNVLPFPAVDVYVVDWTGMDEAGVLSSMEMGPDHLIGRTENLVQPLCGKPALWSQITGSG